MRHTNRIAAVASAAALTFALTACGDDEDNTNANNNDGQQEETTPEETEDEPTEEPVDDAVDDDGVEDDAEATEDAVDDAVEDDEATEEPDDADAAEDDAADAGEAGEGGAAEWAAPISTDGDLLGTVEVGDLEVEIYQVDVVAATRDSMAVDAETEDPIIAEGDDIVYINYVVTNVSDAPVDLGLGPISTSAKYDDWAYLGGMPGIVDSEQFDELGLVSGAFGDGFANEAPYTLAPGESFNMAENFLYQEGSTITWEIDYDQFDENNDRISDSGGEGELETTLN